LDAPDLGDVDHVDPLQQGDPEVQAGLRPARLLAQGPHDPDLAGFHLIKARRRQEQQEQDQNDRAQLAKVAAQAVRYLRHHVREVGRAPTTKLIAHRFATRAGSTSRPLWTRSGTPNPRPELIGPSRSRQTADAEILVGAWELARFHGALVSAKAGAHDEGPGVRAVVLPPAQWRTRQLPVTVRPTSSQVGSVTISSGRPS